MAFKIYEYDLTETATADIDEIVLYISNELHNPDAASAFIDALEEKINEICKNPKSGSLVENDFIKLDEVRWFIVKNYTAYYVTDDDKSKITILRIVYSKRDLTAVLRSLQ